MTNLVNTSKPEVDGNLPHTYVHMYKWNGLVSNKQRESGPKKCPPEIKTLF